MEITLPKPYDMHVHFRQGALLRAVAPWTARFFAAAVVMPNTEPPVLTAHDVVSYRQQIFDAIGPLTGFQTLMTFKIRPDTDYHSVASFKAVGAVAGKVYPRELTTNSGDGVEDYFALRNVFAAMQDLELVLCLHGEKPGIALEGLQREAAFLRTLFLLAKTFPRLRIVLEHITTAAAVDAILALPATVAATITVHHLILTHDDVGGDRMSPHHYCKPVAKSTADREALVEAATSGCPQFFFGSDSAPHLREHKECGSCCAGIFTAPVALPLLAQTFAARHALDRLSLFVHDSAKCFYRLGRLLWLDPTTITLVDTAMSVPHDIEGIVPFCAGQSISWSVRE